MASNLVAAGVAKRGERNREGVAHCRSLTHARTILARAPSNTEVVRSLRI
jgi:hypothetical protein